MAPSSSTASTIEVSSDDGKKDQDSMMSLRFQVNDRPRLLPALLLGAQQMMVVLSGLLVSPFTVGGFVCAGAASTALRVQMISSTFVISGIATLLQTTLGLRLSIMHGPSFAFFPALIAFFQLPEMQCNATETTDVPSEEWHHRMATIQGSLLVASTFFYILGLSGAVGMIARHVGPLTLCPMIVMLASQTVPTMHDQIATHWVAVVEIVLLVFIIICLQGLRVPIPYFSLESKRFRVSRQPIFSQFPYLVGLSLSWILCFLLTVSNLEPTEGAARTDRSAAMKTLSNSPWFSVPLPLYFGAPQVSIGLALGLVASSLACVLESVGNYGICARVSRQKSPPSHSVNRGILMEGFGATLAGLFGVGVGVTTYSENTALMCVTKTACRLTAQIAGLYMIGLGLFTKFSAILATIPDPLMGGLLCIGCSMVCGIGISTLQLVDLRLSRNITILGVAIIGGQLIPLHFEKTPLKTGIDSLDQALNILLVIRMLIGALIGFTLDNVSPGATRAQRGFEPNEDCETVPIKNVAGDQDGYKFPPPVEKFITSNAILSRLPFLPSRRR